MMNTNNIGTVIKALRQQQKLTQYDLAVKLGYADRSAIAKIESNRIDLSTETVKKLAEIFNVSPLYILGLQEDEGTKAKKIPVLGRVAAGLPIEAVENVLDYEEIPVTWAGDYYGLKIKGDSMSPKIDDGDVVIVKLQPDAESGDIVIAIINGLDAVCKKLVKKPEGIVLQSLNPNYEPMYFSRESQENIPVKIWGKVVELRAKF